MTARFSALPVLQYCGQPQVLSARANSGNRATVIGTAHHARASQSPEAEGLLARLTPEELAEVMALHVPTVTTPPGLPELAYCDAMQEIACTLRDAGEVVCTGTTDMAWLLGDVLVVADIKRSSRTVDPTSLQLVGYALALAQEHNAGSFICGLYDATEGTWRWGELVQMFSDAADELHATAVAAARNHGGQYNVGGHCLGCYERSRCPRWLMPPELAETSLAPFTEPGALTNGNALQALITAQRVADTAEEVIRLAKAFARDHGGLHDTERNKIYRGAPRNGRASLDQAALEADHPGLVAGYIKIGAPYEQFGWTNGPKAPKALKAPKVPK